jgi:hypothetical protein
VIENNLQKLIDATDNAINIIAGAELAWIQNVI